MNTDLNSPEAPTPRTDAVARNIGKLIAEYRYGPIGLTATANLIDDELNACRALETDLSTALNQLRQAREALAKIDDIVFDNPKTMREDIHAVISALTTSAPKGEQG